MATKLLKALCVIHLGPTPEEIVKPNQLFEADEKDAQRFIAARNAVEHETEDEATVVKASKPAARGSKPKASASDEL